MKRQTPEPDHGALPSPNSAEGRPWGEVKAELSTAPYVDQQALAVASRMERIVALNRAVIAFLGYKATVNHRGATVIFGRRSRQRYFRRQRTYQWSAQQLFGRHVSLRVRSDGSWRVTSPDGQTEFIGGDLHLSDGVSAEDLAIAEQLLSQL